MWGGFFLNEKLLQVGVDSVEGEGEEGEEY